MFSAAHFLSDYQGKCGNMHGHTYKSDVMVSRVRGGIVDGGQMDGMIIDFHRFKQNSKRYNH